MGHHCTYFVLIFNLEKNKKNMYYSFLNYLCTIYYAGLVLLLLVDLGWLGQDSSPGWPACFTTNHKTLQ